MNVTVTGGTGFLGSAIVRHLVEQGDAVRVICRPTSRTDHLPEGVAIAVADITDAAALRFTLAGADAVIHAAALVTNVGRPWADFLRTNVEAPVTVLRTAADVGIPRLAYISSFLALGPSDQREKVPAASSRHFHNHYERSKAMGAECVRALAGRGLPVVILYPGMLYGPGPLTEGNYVTRTILDLAAGRIPGIIGTGRQRWSLAHVDDVAAGIRAALTQIGGQQRKPGDRIGRLSPGSGRESGMLSADLQPRSAQYVLGGENVALDDLMALLGRIVGVEPPRRHVGPALAWLAGLAGEVRGRVTGRSPRFTRDAAAICRHDWACDSSAAQRDLGYAIRPLEEGLRDLWARLEGK